MLATHPSLPSTPLTRSTLPVVLGKFVFCERTLRLSRAQSSALDSRSTHDDLEDRYVMSNTHNSGSVGCAILDLPDAQSCGKKRKELDSETNTSDYDHASPPRPKLTLPRSAGLTFNGQSQFHPLPPEVNHAILAQLGPQNLFGLPSNGSVAHSSPASTIAGMTPSSSFSTGFTESSTSHQLDYFGKYPAVEPYPLASPSQSCGILGPGVGTESSNEMQVDGGANTAQSHGPQCRSIPQLCVRYNDGNSSELWATCPDCGACSKVESSQPSTNLCYSP